MLLNFSQVFVSIHNEIQIYQTNFPFFTKSLKFFIIHFRRQWKIKSGRDCQVVKLSLCTPKGEGSIPEVEIRIIIIQDFIIQTTKNPGDRIPVFCSLYDEILNYNISDFDLRDRTLTLRSAKRKLYNLAISSGLFSHWRRKWTIAK